MNEVMVTRLRHPFAGQRLEVIGAMRKLGREELLVVLPDGSKTLMPAAWTDHAGPGADQEAHQQAAVLAAPADLVTAWVLISALRARAEGALEQAACKSPCKEDEHAACPAQSDPRTDPGATLEVIASLPRSRVEAAIKVMARLIARAAAATITGGGDE